MSEPSDSPRTSLLAVEIPIGTLEPPLPSPTGKSSSPTRFPPLAASEPAKSPDEKRGSPSKTKQHPIDLSASLASISARLSPYITPAELEIARINRDVALSMAKNPRNGGSESSGETSGSGAGGDNNSDDALSGRLDNRSPGKGNASGPNALTTAIKGGATGSGLHDSLMAEEWVNMQLETSGAYLLPAADIHALLSRPEIRGSNVDDAVGEDEGFSFRKASDSGPLARAGIDRWTLYRLGMPKDLVDRLYRALYVYTNGFHNIINEIASHCPQAAEKHISSNVWLTFLLLLEQCENGKYEMAMLKFKQATQEWRQQMQEEFMNEKLRIEAHVQGLEGQLNEELVRSHEKSELITKLATDTNAANIAIAELQHDLTDKTEQVRLLKLDILVHEDIEKKLNAQIDEARKDYEVANSERFNALTERYALEEEISKLQAEITRLDTEKSNYAKRMHETLFMNQALRATNETLKQNAVIQAMDKDKLEKEKQNTQERVEHLQQELQDLKLQKASVEHDLVESTRRQAHLEERQRAMKEQLDAEIENSTRHLREISNLSTLVDEEKVKVGVLEAKCNLLTAEKANTGMRAQDKLRIERLLNQKLDLENQIEALKLDRTKDQEQIWNLRASLEALDSELQHTKRVFSAGQQAFLHSERSAEQLRSQLQEAEKNYEKASKSLTSLRERFKMFEETSKEQVTKLEVELKVTSAQLREVSYVNRDNVATIGELTKHLEAAEKAEKTLKSRLDAAEKDFDKLRHEKDELQREQRAKEEQSATSKQGILKFLRVLQGLLALVKVDDYPVDEALRELLCLVKDTFGKELNITKVLDDEDEAVEFVEEYDDDELEEAERELLERISGRRLGFSARAVGEDGLPRGGGGASSHSPEEHGGNADDPDVDADADGPHRRRTKTQVSRMSKFRRSKLDTQVKRLQREIEMKNDFCRSLEGVICAQAEELAARATESARQLHWLRLHEQQKGMLRADVEAHGLALQDARQQVKRAGLALEDARIALVMESNRAFQIELAFTGLRRQFDHAGAAAEDLLGRIGRAYAHELHMRALRRDVGSQATAPTAEQFTQTLVPQRNPALERVRVPAMTLPLVDPRVADAESFLQQISSTARALLPGIARTVELELPRHPTTHPPPQAHQHAQHAHQQTRVGHGFTAARPAPSTRGPRHGHGHGHGHGHRRAHAAAAAASSSSAAAAVVAPPVAPHVVSHVNEFGTRHEILISPGYPPFFDPREHVPRAGPGSPSSSSPPRPTEGGGPHGRKGRGMPRKPPPAGQHAHEFHQPHDNTRLDRRRPPNDHERGDATPRKASPGGRSRWAGPSSLPLRAGDPAVAAAEARGALRYHRRFLRTGMEVLRSHGTSGGAPNHDEEEDDDDDVGDDRDPAEDFEEEEAEADDEDNALIREDPTRPRHGRDPWRHGSGASLQSGPSQLELAVREYHDEHPPVAEGSSPSRYYAHRLRDERRQRAHDDWEDDEDEGDDDDEDVDGASRFVPGVLYPLLPPR